MIPPWEHPTLQVLAALETLRATRAMRAEDVQGQLRGEVFSGVREHGRLGQGTKFCGIFFSWSFSKAWKKIGSFWWILEFSFLPGLQREGIETLTKMGRAGDDFRMSRYPKRLGLCEVMLVIRKLPTGLVPTKRIRDWLRNKLSLSLIFWNRLIFSDGEIVSRFSPPFFPFAGVFNMLS